MVVVCTVTAKSPSETKQEYSNIHYCILALFYVSYCTYALFYFR